mgnify:CR=1 FL=1
MDSIYPSICYERFEPRPLAANRVRATASGRVYVQQVVDFFDASLTLNHTWITELERDQLLQLYADNQGGWIYFEDPVIVLNRFLITPHDIECIGPSQVAGGHLGFYFYGTVEVLECFLRFARIQVRSAIHNGIVIL